MLQCRVAAQSWQRKRQFLCLVAEERSSKKVVASCILSLAAPDAVGIVSQTFLHCCTPACTLTQLLQ